MKPAPQAGPGAIRSAVRGLRRAAAALAALSVSACGSTVPLLTEVGLPAIPTPSFVRIEEPVDRPANMIERALSGCDKRIETGEADCLKAALVAVRLAVPDFVAMLRPCRTGEVCHYRYTTDDLVGFGPTASHFIVHWRVDADLTHPAGTIEAVPITVVQVSA